MDIRFLSLSEFHSLYFYRFITLAILLAIGGLILFKLFETPLSDTALVTGCLLVMAWRFAVEWRRVQKSAPAFLHNDELVIASANSHQQIPLAKIRSIKSRHCIFMARRYRSWDDHVAFLEITLNNGERAFTLVESAVLEFPAGKQTLEALRATVATAKAKSLAQKTT